MRPRFTSRQPFLPLPTLLTCSVLRRMLLHSEQCLKSVASTMTQARNKRKSETNITALQIISLGQRMLLERRAKEVPSRSSHTFKGGRDPPCENTKLQEQDDGKEVWRLHLEEKLVFGCRGGQRLAQAKEWCYPKILKVGQACLTTIFLPLARSPL